VGIKSRDAGVTFFALYISRLNGIISKAVTLLNSIMLKEEILVRDVSSNLIKEFTPLRNPEIGVNNVHTESKCLSPILSFLKITFPVK